MMTTNEYMRKLEKDRIQIHEKNNYKFSEAEILFDIKSYIDDTHVTPIIVNKIDEKLGLLPNNGYNTYDLEKRGLEVADRTGRLRHLKYG